MSNRPLLKSSSVEFKGRIFSVVREELELDSGRTVKREFVKHPGAVVILPRANDGRLILERQYRQAVRDVLYEFPAGTLEAGEEPQSCAQRELIEETGFKAARWVELGILYPAPGVSDEKQYCFYASDLSVESGERDEDEIIVTELITVSAVEKLIREGAINDAKSIGVFTRAKLMGLL